MFLMKKATHAFLDKKKKKYWFFQSMILSVLILSDYMKAYSQFWRQGHVSGHLPLAIIYFVY